MPFKYSRKEFIKVYRKFMEWEWYTDTNVKALFLHCLLKANWKPGVWQGIHYDAGEFITSLPSLAEETGLSIQQARTAISRMQESGEITSRLTDKVTGKKLTKNRIITVNNWSSYQGDNRQLNSQTHRQTTGNSTGNQQSTQQQIEEYKEYKEGKNIYGRSPTQFPPSIETISKYIREHKLKVTPERFRDYYEARGWRLAKGRKMTSEEDWHGALMSWEEETDGGEKNTGHFEYERKVDYDEIERQLIAAQRARR